MAACPECGNEVFLGEARCPACGMREPTGPAAPRADDGTPSHVRPGDELPLDGASLLVQKGVADRDIILDARAREERNDRLMGASVGGYAVGGEGGALGGVMGAGVAGFLADNMKVQRDRQGNVIWDAKHALIGGIVLVLLATAFFLYVTMYVQEVTNPTSGMSRYSYIS